MGHDRAGCQRPRGGERRWCRIAEPRIGTDQLQPGGRQHHCWHRCAGRALGLGEESGIRLGGIWVGDTSGILSGGQNPGQWALNSLTILDLNLDADRLIGLKGGSFGTEFLDFTGQNTNGLAGAFPGFDSIEAGPPFNRNELYQLWYRQSLFDDKLIFRIGKSVPTFDFNNVVRPVPVGDPAAAIPAVTALAYTPIFVNPTMLGVIPGYYNSATGITTTFGP